VRALIEQRLAARAVGDDPDAPVLANVVGEVSEQLREVLAQSRHRAAVLLGLIERAGGLNVLLTERAKHLAHHPGQVSFPGGRLEASDCGPIDAALREAWEEVGLAPEVVNVVGCLDPHATGTGFNVTPVVGFVPGTFVARADPTEVDSVFEVPLDFILDGANAKVSYGDRFGSRFRIYEFDYEGYRIWGATAAMLMTFRDIITR